MSIFALSTIMAAREATFSNERIISEFRSGYLLRDICTLSVCIAVGTDIIFFINACLPCEVPICYSLDTLITVT